VKTLSSHNPLQRRPLTPAEYAQLHSAAQSKASWLLRDHAAALETQMAEARTVLEADVAKAEAGMEPLTTRLKRLTSRRSKLMAAIRTALTENAELELLGDRARGVRVQMANVREAVARMEDEFAEAQDAAAKVRARLRRLQGTTERKKAEIEIRLSETDGGRRLLDAADEVDAFRRRKAAQKAGAVEASVSA
jgi:chromosome segregation ATPase